MSNPEEPDLPVSSSSSISLQRILSPRGTPVDTNLVQVNARSNNIYKLVTPESQSSKSLLSASQEKSDSSVAKTDNVHETNGNQSNQQHEQKQEDGVLDRGSTSMKPKSKRPKPKQVTASAAILEAKKNAQAQAKRVTRSSSGSTNNNSTVENIIPEPEIVVMKDHLQPVSG